MNVATSEEHRRFLNRYYGWSRHIYDVTRKYYLLGRDKALERLLEEPWERLVEVGPGTGRNLRKLHRARPSARFGGVDACDEMLEHARKNCPWARLEYGFAEEADYVELLGGRPDRVLFSYCLSMVQDPIKALENARDSLAPGGEVWVVDFGDLAELPEPGRTLLRKWLEAFHVEPLDEGLLHHFDATMSTGAGRYWYLGRIHAKA